MTKKDWQNYADFSESNIASLVKEREALQAQLTATRRKIQRYEAALVEISKLKEGAGPAANCWVIAREALKDGPK